MIVYFSFSCHVQFLIICESNIMFSDTCQYMQEWKKFQVSVILEQANWIAVALALFLGCTLASAIAAELAKGLEPTRAVHNAKAYLAEILEQSAGIATGVLGDHCHMISGESGAHHQGCSFGILCFQLGHLCWWPNDDWFNLICITTFPHFRVFFSVQKISIPRVGGLMWAIHVPRQGPSQIHMFLYCTCPLFRTMSVWMCST